MRDPGCWTGLTGGGILAAEGYLFELEGKGYLQTMAEAPGRTVPASRQSPDVSLQPAPGTQLKERDKPYLRDGKD